METPQTTKSLSPERLRSEIRAGTWTGPTAGQGAGFAQANLVVLPSSAAFDFLLFCQRNPKPCPVLEVLEPGDPVPHYTAPQADIRTDVVSYRVYRHGELSEEIPTIAELWTDDAIAFLLGCSFSFEEALLEAGIRMRHIELGRNVSMYRTSRLTRPAGRFHGREVVSMRPIPAAMVGRAVQVTARMPSVHGAPVHVGAPKELGITSLEDPDYGDPVPLMDGDVPVFWACGVTPQSVALDSKPEWMITHSPGRMFVTDLPNAELEVLGGSFLA